MEKDRYEIKRIGPEEAPAIKELFSSVFTRAPWNDDWSDQEQLDAYIRDLTGQNNSLTYGLYEGETLTGVSMGQIKHWYSGTEYCIDEYCIRTEAQGRGLGSLFLAEIEKQIRELGLVQIFLQTEITAPAYRFYRKQGFSELKEHVSFAKQI